MFWQSTLVRWQPDQLIQPPLRELGPLCVTTGQEVLKDLIELGIQKPGYQLPWPQPWANSTASISFLWLIQLFISPSYQIYWTQAAKNSLQLLIQYIYIYIYIYIIFCLQFLRNCIFLNYVNWGSFLFLFFFFLFFVLNSEKLLPIKIMTYSLGSAIPKS
jgi:hypothetical protein